MTVDLSTVIGAMPSILTNDLRIEVSKESDYPSVFAAQQFSPNPITGHPQRTIVFFGMPVTNYKFRVLIMLGTSTVTVVTVKGVFDAVPAFKEIKYKDPELITVDSTPGFVNGTTSATLDGTSGKEDWRGYEIYPERIGMGTMKRGIDYSWDKTNGIWTLLTTGDKFQPTEYFNVEFGIINVAISQGIGGGGGGGAMAFSDQKLITGTDSILAADAGKKILVKGTSPYFVVSLPDVSTAPELTPYFIELGIGSHKCVRFQCFGSNKIDYGKGNLVDIKGGICESFAIYREKGVAQWRIDNAVGNFLTVGRIIASDADLSVQEFNLKGLDGTQQSVNELARLYEEFVLKLPPSQVCNFADHGLPNNKYKFSLASGGLFYLADFSDIYLRSSDWIVLPGTFQKDMVGPLDGLQVRDGVGGSSTGTIANTGLSGQDAFGAWRNNDDGAGNFFWIKSLNSETRPKSRITRYYIAV